jgi:hypothetical protein
VIVLSARLASSLLVSVYRQNALGMHAGHLGFRYAKGWSIDRIDVDGNSWRARVPDALAPSSAPRSADGSSAWSPNPLPAIEWLATGLGSSAGGRDVTTN